MEAASGPEVVRAARALVSSVLELWDCYDADDAGVLLTSEIVTNAVRHAAGVLAMQLDLSLSDGIVRVSVEDSTSAEPILQPAGAEDISGRGLLLVEALAARWGSKPTERGKVVWFEFPVKRREAVAQAAAVAGGADGSLAGSSLPGEEGTGEASTITDPL
jgi:anti-sigma regulatory factor (Ser/Thr protein kinase)